MAEDTAPLKAEQAHARDEQTGGSAGEPSIVVARADDSSTQDEQAEAGLNLLTERGFEQTMASTNCNTKRDIIHSDPAEKIEPEPCHGGLLAATDDRFRKWFGATYDVDILHAVLAAAAAEQLGGDPVWLHVISGSGDTKTATISALAGVGAIVTSTIASEGALLSATRAQKNAGKATGGLLRRLDNLDRKLLVLKDVTSLISADRNVRATVLAALREIYDGFWERNVGVNGGHSLSWKGRITVIGACTTAWDTHHAVIAQMGDRFVLVRGNSSVDRQAKGLQAMRNTGHEAEMNEELMEAVRWVLIAAKAAPEPQINEAEGRRLVDAAELVTRLRTPCDFDYRGNVENVHALEAPTRFAKQLTQVFRGAVAIGLKRSQALALALRCARDSSPPQRLAILQDVARHRGSLRADMQRRLGLPFFAVSKNVQALQALRLLVDSGKEGFVAADDVDLSLLETRHFVSKGATTSSTQQNVSSPKNLSFIPLIPP